MPSKRVNSEELGQSLSKMNISSTAYAVKLLNFVKERKDDSIINLKDNSRRQLVGLENLSNTCYANAVLQGFFHTEQFTALLKQVLKSYRSRSEKKNLLKNMPILAQLARLHRRMYKHRKDGSLRPDNVFIACKPFFNGEQDSEKPRLEINQSVRRRKASSIHDPSSDSESSYQDDHLADVIGPQQDAQEFLIYLLSQLHDEQVRCLPDLADDADDEGWQETSKLRNGRTKAIKVQNLGLDSDHVETSISSLFQGKFRNTFKSYEGKQETSVTSIPFFDMQLDIESDSVETVEDAIAEYFSRERVLNGDREVGEIYSEIEQLPDILIIQLKRFGFNLEKMRPFKTRKKITVTEDMRVAVKHLSSKCKAVLENQMRSELDSIDYKLFSMVAHEGRSVHSGHYVNYSFNERKRKWFCFNDEHVSAVTDFEKEVRQNDSAYLLFYSLVR